jgi:hypothetical protein
MTNNNLANISIFESLQIGQNARMGNSPMSVFNSPEDVQRMQKAANDLFSALDKMQASQNALQKARQEYDKSQKTLEAAAQKYNQTKEANDKAKRMVDLKEQERSSAAKLCDTTTAAYEKTENEVTTSIQKQELAIVKMDQEKRKSAESAFLKEKKSIKDIQTKVTKKQNEF